MNIYSLCSSALSISPQEAYASQSVSCALLAACSLFVCFISLLLLRRVVSEEAAGRTWLWAKRLFDVFMYQIVASAGIVSVNQFRRVFLVLAAAAGFFQGVAWVLFFMVHDEKFVYNRSNATTARDEYVKFEVSAGRCACPSCTFSPRRRFRRFCRCSTLGQPRTMRYSPSALSSPGT
jgi:hypothetical protein